MQENISPEEKLLDLIKEGNKEDRSHPGVTSGSKPEEPKQESVSLPEKTTAIPRKIKTKSIRSYSIFNRFLIIVALCAAAYMILNYLYPYKSRTNIPEKVEVNISEVISEETPEAPPPLGYYTDILNQRQMFRLYESPKPKTVGPPKPKVTLQQLLSGYTFVGIIFGDVPQAIVEEKRSGQSFYLTAGQFLGEIKVEKIERGKITVSYEDETMDISI